jgi:FkbM family methyltransferase
VGLMNLDVKTLTPGDSIWIYGSGTFSVRVAEKVLELGLQIAGIIDHLPRKIEINGQTYSSQNLDELLLPDKSTILLGVCNLHGDLKKIRELILSSCESAKIISPVEFVHIISNSGLTLENYWLGERLDFYSKSLSEIEAFRDLLADQQSKDLYDSILKYRKFGNIDDVPTPEALSKQYLPVGLATPPKDLHMLDLGACQGENLDFFLDEGHTFKFGLFVEPDIKNFEQLAEKIRELDLMNVVALPLASWSSNMTLTFDGESNASSHISNAGFVHVQAIKVDDMVGVNRINYIKMDIEGAEMDALIGASSILLRDLPHLAISVYHKPDDLWALGAFIEALCKDKYNFFLRNYGHQTFDTLLYAVPRI